MAPTQNTNESNKLIVYALPIISGILTVLALPPFDFWYLGFVSLVPFAVFLIKEHSRAIVFNGGALFGIIFSGYLASVLFPSFAWLPQAYLFRDFIRFLPIPVMLFTAVWAGGFASLFLVLKKNLHIPLFRAFLLSGMFVLNEWFISSISFGFNYGSFSYIGVHLSYIRMAANMGGVLLVSFLVFFTNVALAEVVITSLEKGRRRWLSALTPIIFLGVGLILVVGLVQFKQSTSVTNKESATRSIRVAIIQDSTRITRHIFGETTDDVSNLESLEQALRTAEAGNPDIIIYPLSPWQGVITDTGDTKAPRGVTVTDAEVFGAWLKARLSPDTVFVAWGTALRNGVYTDEIEFWEDGEIIGAYKKREPFVFMDYTPQWAQRLGFYSTPIDITAGTSTAPVQAGGVAIGGLVCSEITAPSVASENAKNSDIVFAIGTEAMFSGSIAEAFNLMNAQLRATETGKPLIRANAFGPSAIIDGRGSVISEIRYGEEGVLFGTINLPAEGAVVGNKH